MAIRLFAVPIVIGLAAAAHAQPVPLACSLVCLPPSHLNEQKCACEDTAQRKPVCSVVCLTPDETLDARKCACVRRR